MKRSLLLSTLVLCLIIPGLHAQITTNHRASVNPLINVGVLKSPAGDMLPSIIKPANPSVKAGIVDEANIGETRYDLQTNTATQNRIWVYGDGTIGATWTQAFADPGYADRGTGYNYYDGTSWGTVPSNRIETIRTGWPSYAPWGPSGEIIVNHDFATSGGLVVLTRSTKGAGAWTTNTLKGPTGHTDVAWPRMITGGANNNTIHVIYTTKSTANGGTPYLGLEGAILYARSNDGGLTWNPKDVILPGMDATNFYGFSADAYAWAAAKGDTIAFVCGDSWHDLFMMKSPDGGNNWVKTTIWAHPYPLFNLSTPIQTDTFYCPDGAVSLAFDSQGKAHLFFGVNRAHSDGTGTFWFPFVDGIAYWNEDMPSFTSPNFKYTLNPDTLYNHDQLVAWVQDINQNDTMDFLTGGIDILGKYYLSLSSMPNVSIDENDNIFLAFSSVTEGKDNGLQNYRHIWSRAKYEGYNWSDFTDLTGSIIHNFDECVFPSVAPKSNSFFHLIYQLDEEPGLSVRGDEDPPTDNFINYLKVMKSVGIAEIKPSFTLSSIYPNPARAEANLVLYVERQTTLQIKIMTLTGQVVYVAQEQCEMPGAKKISLPISNLKPGFYLCQLSDGKTMAGRKMVVQK